MVIFVAYPYALKGYREALLQSLTAPDFTLLYADEHIADDHVLRKIEGMLEVCDLALFDVTGAKRAWPMAVFRAARMNGAVRTS